MVCKYLNSTDWNNIKKLRLKRKYLSDVKGDIGCEYLTSSKWDQLYQLDLCKY